MELKNPAFSGTRAARAAWESLRPAHWAKNLLVFVPLITAHRLADKPELAISGIAFGSFSMLASCVYLVNDAVDLPADRAHPRKRLRPMASGRLSVAGGLALAVLMLGGAGLLAWRLPFAAQVLLFAYLGFSFLYSFRLKRYLLLDVMSLAVLYTLRIVVGHAATGIAFSPWLLSFAIFLFFSLAFCKRASELGNLKIRGGKSASGRGYSVEDYEVVMVAGIASGFAACIIFMLYLGSDAILKLYVQPEVLWLLVPAFLYWICRLWILAGRRMVDEDPVLFALKDPVTFGVVAWCAIWLMLGTHRWFPNLHFTR